MALGALEGRTALVGARVSWVLVPAELVGSVACVCAYHDGVDLVVVAASCLSELRPLYATPRAHTDGMPSSPLGSLPSTLCSIRFLNSLSKNARSSLIFVIPLSSLTLLVLASSLAASTSFSRRFSSMHFR